MDIFKALGWAAAGLLALSNLYTPYKWLRRLLDPIEDKSLLKQLNRIQRALLNLHCYGNLGATALSLAHTFARGPRRIHSDPLAWLSLAIMAWLSVSGLIMRTKYFPSGSKRAARLLHAQYVLSLVLIIVLGGHVLVGGEFEFGERGDRD